MILIDTHLHLLKEDNKNISEIIKRAEDNDVKYLILGGSSIKDNLENISLAKEHDNIFITLGYHPEEVLNISNDDLVLLENQIIENKEKVVGIGEIGLDYFYNKNNQNEQKELFIKQIKLANKYNKPIVVHSRDAVMDTLNILKQNKCFGVIHCFSGSLEVAKEYIKLGYKLGIGGVLTFKNSNLKNIINDIPINSILLETDSPFLSPDRGTKNEPKNIRIIAEYLSNLTNHTIDEIASITTNNAIDVFDLKYII